MTRRRLSAGQRPSEPLEYLLDRSLGRNVSNELERLGWIIHRITDEFPNDAQDVPRRRLDKARCSAWMGTAEQGRSHQTRIRE